MDDIWWTSCLFLASSALGALEQCIFLQSWMWDVLPSCVPVRTCAFRLSFVYSLPFTVAQGKRIRFLNHFVPVRHLKHPPKSPGVLQFLYAAFMILGDRGDDCHSMTKAVLWLTGNLPIFSITQAGTVASQEAKKEVWRRLKEVRSAVYTREPMQYLKKPEILSF